MVLKTVRGERIEIPWDFARHYCDESYRPTVEAIAMRGRLTLGGRIRQFRESAGLTQEALAQAADIGRVTLVRLEKGEQTPRFKTLNAIAQALGRRVPEFLVEPELLPR
jgi:DNA-binding XRE family transcriptional regulator